jgi:hypothetical protein
MNRRDIVVGLVILVAVVGVVLIRSRRQPTAPEMQVPQTLSVEDTIENKFNLQIPDDVEKAELKDASGGTSSAIATRKYENGQFELTILADLPDPDSGSYAAQLIEGDQVTTLGSLTLAKGGYLLEYSSPQDRSTMNSVRVMLGNSTVLEGQF